MLSFGFLNGTMGPRNPAVEVCRDHREFYKDVDWEFSGLM